MGAVPEDLIAEVLPALLPDDDNSGENHPWSWLAELANARGFDVTAEQLKELPYQVVLTDRVNDWLKSS